MLPLPICLDAFSGAGGCGYGYWLAGFHVIGVDINPQPNYPFEFIQDDAIEFIRKHGNEFDFIHTSPPCQFGTQLRHAFKNDVEYSQRHPNLIPDTRAALLASEKPYVIENVPGAKEHLVNPVMLCGKMFSLLVYRHRYFECSFPVNPPKHLKHNDKMSRHGLSPKGYVTLAGHNHSKMDVEGGFSQHARKAMAINWMSRAELSQAIPPAYTQYIGAEWLMQNGYRYQYPDVYAPKQLELFA